VAAQTDTTSRAARVGRECMIGMLHSASRVVIARDSAMLCCTGYLTIASDATIVLLLAEEESNRSAGRRPSSSSSIAIVILKM
jgi:hypothetical protein